MLYVSEAQDRLLDVYERLEELDSDLAEVRAAEILFGLGFNKEMQNKKVSCIFQEKTVL